MTANTNNATEDEAQPPTNANTSTNADADTMAATPPANAAGDGTTTVFIARGLAERYHTDRKCPPLVRASGAIHEVTLRALNGHRAPCAWCCTDGAVDASAATDGDSDGVDTGADR